MSGRLYKVVQWFLNPPSTAPTATILVRLMAGGVFVSEGILKFVFPNTLGAGRFIKASIPFPAAMADFVAVVEIVFGTLLVLGLLTRLAAVPLIIDIVVAMVSTKIPLWLGTSHLPAPPVPPQVGVWAVLHEGRSDFAQLLCTMFLLIVGAGPWAVDALRARGRAQEELFIHRSTGCQCRAGLSHRGSDSRYSAIHARHIAMLMWGTTDLVF